MRLIKTPLKGAFIIYPEKIEDSRGFFARLYCYNEFKKRGFAKQIVQINTSYSNKKGTLRGLHYQVKPYEENKIMRCIQGAIFDVIIDLRPESGTYCNWYGTELSAVNRKMIIVPEGFAHGFQALADGAEVIYPTTEFYSQEHERGIRWNDSMFNIKWPISNPVVSEKDRSFGDFKA